MEIRLIGQPRIIDDTGAVRPVRGQQTWVLLARILLTDRPLSRRTLAAELFSSADDPLGALRWCLAGLRRACDSPEVFAGDPVVAGLPPGTRVDVAELEAGRFDVDEAGELVELLEGVEARCSAECDTWLLVQRHRVAGLVDAELRSGVLGCLSCGDAARAVELASLAVRRSVFDEGAHVLLVKSLVAAGSHHAALTHVDETEALFRRELGTGPTPALRSAARRRLAAPPMGVSRRAIAASLLESGRAAVAAGAIDAGIECLRRAADDADLAGDDRLAAVALFELGTALVHTVRSHDDEGALVLRQSADLADRLDDRALGTEAHRELGYVDALAGRRPASQAHLTQARNLADGDERLLAGVHAVNALNLGDWGRHDDALADYQRAIEAAHATDNPRREAWALGLGAWTRLIAGDVDGAEDWTRRCLDLTNATRWVAFRPWPLVVLAEAHLAAGRTPHEVRDGLEESFALSCSLADPCWESAGARIIALTHSAAGDHSAALAWITDAQRRCTRETDIFVGLHAAILADDSRIAAAAGDPVRAEHSARQLVALAARTHMDAHLHEGLRLLGSSS